MSSRRATGSPWCAARPAGGESVGIVANNGVLFSESALKGAHFIQLCGRRRIPLIFLQNITGFMVGKRYEQGGITRDGAKMVQAVATAAVPKITVIVGASHGAGNYAMCGRGTARGSCSRGRIRGSPSWAQSRRPPSSSRSSASSWRARRRRFGGRRGAIAGPCSPSTSGGDPYFGTARLWDDGIIDPVQTRAVVALALSAALNAPIAESRGPRCSGCDAR